MMRIAHATARTRRAVLTAMAVLAVLTACTAPPANGSGSDLRVTSVQVVIASRQEFLLGIPVPTAHNIPPPDSGLTRNKIVSDITRALQADVVAHTQGGTRPVTLRIGVHKLQHPATGQDFTKPFLYIEAYVDVIDARTAAPLVTDKKVWSVYYKPSATMVQQYNALISEFVDDVKDVLLR